MNEKKPRKSEKTSTGKGIYAAIYGSVAIMLLIAAVIGVNNLLQTPSVDLAQPQGVAQTSEEPASLGVGSSLDEPITGRTEDRYSVSSGAEDEQANEDEVYDIESRRRPQVSDKPAEEDAPKLPEEKPAESAKPSEEAPATKKPQAEAPSEGLEPSYEAFNEGDTMIWPLEGEILMGYSMNHLIYDSTLEQYRTNGNICIGGELGDHVRAAAGGVVTESYNSRRAGKTVTIFHGNGWSTNYSQLQDNVEVKVGDIVEQGQLIGMVGDPSIYSQQLGNHLEFSVLREEDLVDPIGLLARN